jgi:hypothetical protein
LHFFSLYLRGVQRNQPANIAKPRLWLPCSFNLQLYVSN